MKNILKYSILAGLFVIPFIPFIVFQSTFFPFITGKGFTFRILVDLIFGLYVCLAALAPEFRLKMSWITKALTLFIIVLLVADLFSANPYKSFWSNYERMEGFVLIAHLFLYYIVASSVLNTKALWTKLLNTSIVASLIMCGYGALQLMGLLTINQGGVRVDGTFGNAAYFAIYLVFHIFLCLYFLAGDIKAKWLKWVYGFIALFEIYILYFTATRGAILGLIGGLFLTGILIVWKERGNPIVRKTAYWLLGGVGAVVVLFVLLRGTAVVQRSPVLSRFSTLSFQEFQTQGRYYVWPMAVKGFVQSPKTFIIGWGQESFNYVFNKYYDPRMYGQEQWFDRTHDIVLDWLIAGGLLGLLSYASIYIALFYLVWRKNSPLKLSEKSVLTGMIAAYIFHNIFVFDNLISYILFFTILAFIHFMTSDEGVKRLFGDRKLSADVLNYAVIPSSLIVTLIVLYFVNIPAVSANVDLIKAISPQQAGPEQNYALFKKVYANNSFGSDEATEQLISLTSQIASANANQLPASIRQEFYDLAKDKIVTKTVRTPHDARYFVFAGTFFEQFHEFDTAISYFEKALTESPKKQQIYLQIGSAYVNKGDFASAFQQFKKAYDLDHDSPESQAIYAIGAIYTKNVAVLNEMSAKIPKTSIVTDNRFLQAYAQIGDFTQVINILNERLKGDPNNQQYKLSLASAYAQIGNKAKAVSIINEIIAQDPNFKAQGEQYIQQIQNS